MSIAHVRKAFSEAGGGKLTCTKARMRYERAAGNEHQVLEFDGFHSDGTPFSIKSDRIRPQSSLHEAAKATAANYIKQREQGAKK